MEYHPNGWVDTGLDTHYRYALGYSIVINVENEGRTYGVTVYSIHGVERINQQFDLESAKLRADQWLHRKANEYSTEFPAYEKAFKEGYSTRVMEEQHGYEPYQKGQDYGQ